MSLYRFPVPDTEGKVGPLYGMNMRGGVATPSSALLNFREWGDSSITLSFLVLTGVVGGVLTGVLPGVTGKSSVISLKRRAADLLPTSSASFAISNNCCLGLLSAVPPLRLYEVLRPLRFTRRHPFIDFVRLDTLARFLVPARRLL